MSQLFSKTDASYATEDPRSSTNDFATVERKLAKFRKLYTSYRKDETVSQIKMLDLPLPEVVTSAATSPGGRSRVSDGGAPHPRRPSPSSLSRASSQQPQLLLQQVLAGVPIVSEQRSQLQSLVLELEAKDRAVSSLQLQLNVQEAREDEGRAYFQRQIQQLEDKLASTTEQLHRLETERWEVLEAVSTVAAGSVHLDREQRSIERTRQQLEEKRLDLEAREVSAATDRLSLEALSGLASFFPELDVALCRTDSALRRRVMLLSGREPGEWTGPGGAATDGRRSGTSSGSAVGTADGVDLSHDPCMSYLQDVREAMTALRTYLATNTRSERQLQLMSSVPIIQHLQQQANGLARALVLLASEGEADTARLALVEAQSREREAQLAVALQENRRLAILAEAADHLEALRTELRKEREENASLQSRMRAMRKKLKAAFEDMATQNKDLREKLKQTKDQNSAIIAELDEEMRQLKEKLAESAEQLQVQRLGEEELQAEIRRARQQATASAERVEKLSEELEAARVRAQRMQELEEDLEDVESRAEGVSRRVAELEGELKAERDGAAQVAANHEAQLNALRAEVKLQLQLVVDAYTEELRALQAQLAIMEKAQREAMASAAATGLRGAVGGPAVTAPVAADASRSEVWRMAYEEAQEQALSLGSQLEAAKAENARLQGQLQRLTAAAVARALDSSGSDPAPRKLKAAVASTSTFPAAPRPRAAGATQGSSFQQLHRRPPSIFAETEVADTFTIGSSLVSTSSQEVADLAMLPLRMAAATAGARNPRGRYMDSTRGDDRSGPKALSSEAAQRQTVPRVRSVAVKTELSVPQVQRASSSLLSLETDELGATSGTGQTRGLASIYADATAATEPPQLRQQGAQTDLAAAAAQRTTSVEDSHGAGRVVIVVRQEPLAVSQSATNPTGASGRRKGYSSISTRRCDTRPPSSELEAVLQRSHKESRCGDRGRSPGLGWRRSGKAQCDPRSHGSSRDEVVCAQTPGPSHGKDEARRYSRIPRRSYSSEDEGRWRHRSPDRARSCGAEAKYRHRRHSAGSGPIAGQGRGGRDEDAPRRLPESMCSSSEDDDRHGEKADWQRGLSFKSVAAKSSSQVSDSGGARKKSTYTAGAHISGDVSVQSVGVGSASATGAIAVHDASVQEDTASVDSREDDGVVVDTGALNQHVASLQEQLAALTHQNSIITSQVIEIRLRQEAQQLEQQGRLGLDAFSTQHSSPHSVVDPAYGASPTRATLQVQLDHHQSHPQVSFHHEPPLAMGSGTTYGARGAALSAGSGASAVPLSAAGSPTGRASWPQAKSGLHSSVEIELYPPASGRRITSSLEDPIPTVSPYRDFSPSRCVSPGPPRGIPPYYSAAERAADFAAASEQQARRERLEAARRELLHQPRLPPSQPRPPQKLQPSGDGIHLYSQPAGAAALHFEPQQQPGAHDSGSEVSFRAGLAGGPPPLPPPPPQQQERHLASNQLRPQYPLQHQHRDLDKQHVNSVADELAFLRAQYSQLQARYELQAMRHQELQEVVQQISSGRAAAVQSSKHGTLTQEVLTDPVPATRSKAGSPAAAAMAERGSTGAGGLGSSRLLAGEDPKTIVKDTVAAVEIARTAGSEHRLHQEWQLAPGPRTVTGQYLSAKADPPSSSPSSASPQILIERQDQHSTPRRYSQLPANVADGRSGNWAEAGDTSRLWVTSESESASQSERQVEEFLVRGSKGVEQWPVSTSRHNRASLRQRGEEHRQQAQPHGSRRAHEQQMLQAAKQQEQQERQQSPDLACAGAHIPVPVHLKPPSVVEPQKRDVEPQPTPTTRMLPGSTFIASANSVNRLPTGPAAAAVVASNSTVAAATSALGSGAPTAAAAVGGSLGSQRSGDLFIATTPFFPLGPETSEFLDRATSVDVGFYPDPDLAMTADGGTYGRTWGPSGGGGGSPARDEGSNGDKAEEGESASVSAHTVARSSSMGTFPGDEEDEHDALGEGEGAGMGDEEDEDEDDMDGGSGGGSSDGVDMAVELRSETVSSYGTESVSSESLGGAGSAAGRLQAAMSQGVPPRHTTSSFMAMPGRGRGSRSGSGSDGDGERDDDIHSGSGVDGVFGGSEGVVAFDSPFAGEAAAAFRAASRQQHHHHHHHRGGQRQGTHQCGDLEHQDLHHYHEQQHRHRRRRQGRRHHQHSVQQRSPAAFPLAVAATDLPAVELGLQEAQSVQLSTDDNYRRDQQQQLQQQQALLSNVLGRNALDGPVVPPDVLERMALYAGDEGLARPSTAVPSALRPDASDRGPPVPPEVLSYLEQYTGGGEGDVRPSTASPSVLRARTTREVPVPPEVLSYMLQYTGDEGGARPSSAAPSVLAAGRSSPEMPVPDMVLHMAAQFQAGGEGVSRPTTAPSSNERRTRLAATPPQRQDHQVQRMQVSAAEMAVAAGTHPAAKMPSTSTSLLAAGAQPAGGAPVSTPEAEATETGAPFRLRAQTGPSGGGTYHASQGPGTMPPSAGGGVSTARNEPQLPPQHLHSLGTPNGMNGLIDLGSSGSSSSSSGGGGFGANRTGSRGSSGDSLSEAAVQEKQGSGSGEVVDGVAITRGSLSSSSRSREVELLYEGEQPTAFWRKRGADARPSNGGADDERVALKGGVTVGEGWEEGSGGEDTEIYGYGMYGEREGEGEGVNGSRLQHLLEGSEQHEEKEEDNASQDDGLGYSLGGDDARYEGRMAAEGQAAAGALETARDESAETDGEQSSGNTAACGSFMRAAVRPVTPLSYGQQGLQPPPSRLQHGFYDQGQRKEPLPLAGNGHLWGFGARPAAFIPDSDGGPAAFLYQHGEVPEEEEDEDGEQMGTFRVVVGSWLTRPPGS